MTKVMEINKLVFALMHLSSDRNSVMQDILVKDLNRVHLTGETSGYDTVLDFCRMLGMVKCGRAHVMLTDRGIQYSELYSSDDEVTNLDPNMRQRKMLLAMLLDSDEIMAKVAPFIDGLCIDFASVPKSWFARVAECYPMEILDFMDDVGFVSYDGKILRIHPDMSHVVSRIKHRGKKTMNQEELMFMLQINRDTGDDAENLTMESERSRLEGDGFSDMAMAIQKISTVDVAAGYDILSFDGKGSSYEHDRMIETKGTRGNGDVFFWSNGEIEAAKRFGNAYWIYFWRNVGNKGMETLDMINDPYDRFWRRSNTKPRPVAFRVECRTEEIKTG